MTWKSLKLWVDGELEPFDFAPTYQEPSPKRQSSAQIPESTQRRALCAISVICALVILAALLLVVYTLPLFGTGMTTDNELSQRYIEQGMDEVGAQNLVANMILVYRGFDTFGESTVLFTAATCVIMLLMGGNAKKEESIESNTEILRTVVRGMFPFILIFGVYILLNGHLSPGGGFSGGAVLGAGMILLDVSLSSETIRRFFNHTVYTVIKVGALCVYCGVILFLTLCGANGLDTGIPLGLPGHIISAGVILPINLMVGFEVACTMYAFFTYFYRGELK